MAAKSCASNSVFGKSKTTLFSVSNPKRKSENVMLRQKRRKISSATKSKDASIMTSVSNHSLNYVRDVCQERAKDVDAKSLRSAKDLYEALVEKGFEDFVIVLIERGATAQTIGVLCRKYPNEVKGLKFDVTSRGELLITKFATGPEHQSAVQELTRQIGNFIANGGYDDIDDSSDELSLTVHSPDVIICPFRFDENNRRHPRVSIEVEVDHRSGIELRREGLRQFNDIPMLRMFIGVKFWRPSRILVAQYAKNDDDNIVLQRAMSIGSENVSRQGLQKWKTMDDGCLPPIAEENVERFQYPYEQEQPVLEIPGNYIWYHIPTAQANVFSLVPDNAILRLHLSRFARALLRF